MASGFAWMQPQAGLSELRIRNLEFGIWNLEFVIKRSRVCLGNLVRRVSLIVQPGRSAGFGGERARGVDGFGFAVERAVALVPLPDRPAIAERAVGECVNGCEVVDDHVQV
jgi:hypothetical protein